MAIIGAGPAGVLAAKYSLAENVFHTIDVFEQQRSFGGVWNYDPAKKNTADPLLDNTQSNTGDFTFISPMYDGLETNVPHCLMPFSNDSSLPLSKLFPSRETVLTYIEDYSQEIKHLVQFNTEVTDVRLDSEGEHDSWTINYKQLSSRQHTEAKYDAVVVANGHYSKPSVPHFEGVEAWARYYPEAISHSKYYRNPEPFRNKKVIVVGNAASGVDICSQIATVARCPILLSQRSDSPMAFAAPYKQPMPEIAEFIAPCESASRAVRFTNGHIEYNIDKILLCTGYEYSFPFLSSIQPEVVDTGDRVKCLYQQIFYYPHPTLTFLGLPSKVVPLRTFAGQALVAARHLAGRLALPSKNEMRRWEEQRIQQCGTGKAFHGRFL